MLSTLFTSVADALISYAIDKLDPAEQIKSWLKLDPARIAFQKALARAYSAFARQYPEYTSSLFDQSFLSKEALPELSKLLTRSQHPDPALLAQAWGQSIGKDTDFAQAATKPASYFIERLEGELKAEPAMQALFDSRALESLPKLEAEIQKLASDLKHGLDEALKAANNYQQANIHVGGDVKGDGIIIGHNNSLTINKYDYSTNYYYTGDFVSLNEYYIPPDGVFQRVRVDEFVGRDWLTAKVDAFLNDPSQKSGAFLLVGDAGVGKTSFMAHLVKERRYLHLFAEQAPGQAMLQRAMQSLGSQLVTRYQIDPYKDRDTLNALSVFPDFLERILRLAASKLTNGEKIVIVCDALDEAGVFPDHFVFGLPKELPDGVYFILSQRPVNVKLPNFEPVIEKLEAQGEGNLQDIESYLSAVAKRSEVAGQIRSKEYSEEFFIQTLKEKSQGVWMYLHYIIKEIESGARAPLDLANLPTGLVGYYTEYWDAWRTGKRGDGKKEWFDLYAPLLATLAASQESVTAEQLTQWAGVATNPEIVEFDLLKDKWRSFLVENKSKNDSTYAVYHLSFRDFISGKVDIDKLDPNYEPLISFLAKATVKAHKRIIDAFEKECNGEWEKLVEQDYSRLHLTAHLNGAGEYEKLRLLLTEGGEKIKWAEAREQKEETYAGYLNDLTYIWAYAEREQNYALATRCMLIENSIHSLAANIPPLLLAELAKAGVWSYAKCLSIIRQKTKPDEQEKTLELILPSLPSELNSEIFSIARAINEESHRVNVLNLLIPRLQNGLKKQAVLDVCKIRDEYFRSIAVEAFAPCLDTELKMRLLAMAREIKDDAYRASALGGLAPYVDGDLKEHLFQETLSTIQKIDGFYRAYILGKLAPYLSDEIKDQELLNTLDLVLNMESYFNCVRGLVFLMPHLKKDQKSVALSNALGAARRIEEEGPRSYALGMVAPHLESEQIPQYLEVAYEFEDEALRATVLGCLAPHLNKELKAYILKEIFALIGNLKSESDCAKVLELIAAHLDDELQAKALLIAHKMNHGHARARALGCLSPFLDTKLKVQTLHDAILASYKVEDEDFRSDALSALVPYLSDEQRMQAFLAVNKIKYEDSRITALSFVVPYLNDEIKESILQEIFSVGGNENTNDFSIVKKYELFTPHLTDRSSRQAFAALTQIKNEHYRTEALEQLVLYLDDDLKAHALFSLDEFKYEISRAHALELLVPHLNSALKAQALLVIRGINDEYTRKNTLETLAPHFADQFTPHVLSMVYELKHASWRASVLAAFIPHLRDEVKAQMLQATYSTVREIENQNDRIKVLVTLCPYLDGELKVQALHEAYLSALEIKSVNYRANILGILSPHLNDELKVQALHEAYLSALEIKDATARIHVLAALIPHLGDSLRLQALEKALESTREIGYRPRADAFSCLAPYLNAYLGARALSIALETRDEEDLVRSLEKLVPYLNDELRIQVLSVAYKIKSEYRRDILLGSLVPYLDEKLKAQIFLALLKSTDNFARAFVLDDIVLHLADQDKITALGEILYLQGKNLLYFNTKKWKTIEFKSLKEYIISLMRLISQEERTKGIEVIEVLTPALINFSGPKIAPELYRTITDVTRWWP